MTSTVLRSAIDAPATTNADDGLPLRACAAWKRGVGVVRSEDGLVVGDEAGAVALRPLPEPLADLLLAMVDTPLDLAAVETDLGTGARLAVDAVLERVGQRVARHWQHDGQDQLVAEHTARGSWPVPTPLAGHDVLRLHRFALVRTHLDDLVLECPLTTTRFVLATPVLRALVPLLGRARDVEELAEAARRVVPEAAVVPVLGLLLDAGVLERADPEGRFPSETEPALRQWDYHDLLMHSRVRSGRFDAVHGAAYPYRGEIAPTPARRPVPGGERTALERPHLAAVAGADASLTEVLETRRSIREYGDVPMTLVQLGEFLYRTARTRAFYRPEDPADEERVSRPYPSGGGAYELELFLTVRRCAGLTPGLYYYDPVGHALVRRADFGRDAELMLNVASAATGLEARPDVLVTFVSRFGRLSWKYRSIAYATSLRHTGVLYQTMYLVATAMGLAPCGLGNGDADLAAHAFGLDYLTEASIGDFALGSRPDADPTRGDALAPGWSLLNDGAWSPQR